MRALTSARSRTGRAARVLGAALLVGVASLQAVPAHAAPSVTVDADGRGAVIDSTYSTTLTVSGRGFTSIKKGHGGIYVWFGTVNGDWKPSQGGTSGVNYVYVPDKESKDNSGFQRYVAFPDSATASSANGGSLSLDGSFSTTIVVPGPKFEAVGRNGGTTTVDCRTVTCGIITIGAHGVRNANNETFTPVKLADLGPSAQSTTEPEGGDAPAATAPGKKSSKAATSKAPAVLTLDHTAAVPGGALSFTADNVVPGEQFTVVLDDGRSAVGPFAAGDDGRAAGVISLPRDLEAGTHTVRLFGSSKEAELNFGVRAVAGGEAVAAEEEKTQLDARWFALGAGVVFLLSLAFTASRVVRSRRA